ncbi:MAG: siroheme decarboxylase subunit beta [Planctomycetota bacterium]|jgi:DNA-binding Lrp family transcriptional regulator
MTSRLSDIECKILAVIQEGFPKSQNPYSDMAERAGVKTEELLAVLRSWEKNGKLRRIGAIVNHFKVGLEAGAMVVWQVDTERIEEVGLILAGFEQVSHAYERLTSKNWPYNMYTMVHGANSEDVQRVVNEMSKLSGVSNYRILSTEKELKKVPPTYILEAETRNIQEKDREC